ncbi:MAG: RNA methyltransferase [Lachnospiraceae bacterium]|nr:RNA methyltransferase [Lachnospiraceae bacterium]
MITGSGNAQLKKVRELLRSREARDREGIFAAEGLKIFEEVPEEAVRAIYVSESFQKEHGDLLRGQEYEVVADSRFGSISDTKNPQGVIALLEKPAWKMQEIFRKEAPLLLAAEHLQDPGNAGTILRTAEAAGADAVIFTEDSVDIFNPKVVRATMGSIFRMPVFYVKEAKAFAEMLWEHGIRSYAAYLPGSTVYDVPDYTGGTCFFIGNESKGLTVAAAEAADVRIRIPMTEHINSLNAAMAAGILLYEAARQRRVK